MIIITRFAAANDSPVAAAYPLGHGHRWYLPSLMRFNAPDSLSPFGLGGSHPYAYCASDPINHTDPTGQMIDAEILATMGDLLERVVAREDEQVPALGRRRRYSATIDGSPTSSSGREVRALSPPRRRLRLTEMAPEGAASRSAVLDHVRDAAASVDRANVHWNAARGLDDSVAEMEELEGVTQRSYAAYEQRNDQFSRARAALREAAEHLERAGDAYRNPATLGQRELGVRASYQVPGRMDSVGLDIGRLLIAHVELRTGDEITDALRTRYWPRTVPRAVIEFDFSELELRMRGDELP